MRTHIIRTLPALLVVLVMTALGTATAQAARVANPGPVQFRFETGNLQIRDRTFEAASSDEPVTGNATVASNGTLSNISLNFPPLDPVEGPFGNVNITITLLSASGNVNPLTGLLNLNASLRIDADGGGVGSDCRISPIHLALSSANAGGSGYSSLTNRATITDHTFSVPGAQGCDAFFQDINGMINDELGLPSPSGQNHATLTLSSNPVLQPAVRAAFVPTPSSGPAPLPVTFAPTGSSATAGIATYHWDFTNNGSFDQTTTAASPNASFTYPAQGTYVAKLRVTDSQGDFVETTRTVVVGPPQPDLAITKGHGFDFVTGTPGTWTIGVTNSGTAPTSGPTTVLDDLPAGVAFTSAVGDGWVCGEAAGDVTCTYAATLAVGQSAPPITLQGTPGTEAVGVVTNRATVDGAEDSNPSNDVAQDSTVVRQSGVDLVATKDLQDGSELLRGQQAVYEVGVRNGGTLPAEGRIVLTDQVPAGLVPVAAQGGLSWTCSITGQLVRCFSDNDVAPGAALSNVVIRVEVDGNADSTVTNTAVVTVEGESNPADNTASHDGVVTGLGADLRLVKEHPGDFAAGGPGIYTLTVTNVGTAAAKTAEPDGTPVPVTVRDLLPDGMTFVSGAGEGWSCAADGQIVTCTTSGVEPGDPVDRGESLPAITLRVQVAGDAGGELVNRAAVSHQGDGNPDNDSAQDPTIVGPSLPDLAVAKSHEGNMAVGFEADYTISVTNGAAQPALGAVTVTDTLPGGMTAVSAAGEGWACDLAAAPVVTCTRDGLEGATTAPPITLRVEPTAEAVPAGEREAVVVNVATVAAANDTDGSNDRAEDPTLVRLQPAASQLFAEGIVLTITRGGISAILNGPRATLTSDGQPVANKEIVFKLRGGSELCRARTSARGRAVCGTLVLPVLQATLAGSYTATWQGDGDVAPSSDSAGLIVNRR